ncbi:MAG: hypothetical protein ACI8Z5_000169 [Lentimonas sp.]|jgi:hypothetical protein
MSQFMDKLKQYPVAVVGVIVLLLCAGIALLRSGVVDELTIQEDELQARIGTIDRNVRNSKNLEQDVAALDAYVALIDERLFNRKQRSVNTNFFYSFEDTLDILISDVNQMAAEDPSLIKGGPNELKLYSGVSYEIRVDGSFQEILGFLYEIHNADALMRVAKCEVGVAGSASAPGYLSAKLRVVVLAQQE